MAPSDNETTKIFICSFCKDQIEENQKDSHVKTCALIPEADRDRMSRSNEPVCEKLEVENATTEKTSVKSD